MDTHPLAADPAVIIAEQPDAFALGLDLLARLTTGNVFVCSAPDAEVPSGTAGNVKAETFAGPHPAVDSNEPGAAGFTGSLVIAEFPSLEDAQAWANTDPFVDAGVYRNVTVKPFKVVLP